MSASSIAAFELPLTQEKIALVDESDRALVEQFTWHAHEAESGRWYARNNKHERLHRVLMGCVKGDGRIIDHENRNTLDCRRANLRESSSLANAQNVTAHKDGHSKHVGVSFERRRQRWTAAFWRNGRHIMTPMYFTSEKTAARARNFVALLWGVYGN